MSSEDAVPLTKFTYSVARRERVLEGKEESQFAGKIQGKEAPPKRKDKRASITLPYLKVR